MKRILSSLIFCLFASSFVFAQEGGNRVYGRNNTDSRRKPALNTGALTGAVDGRNQQFIEASVLLNAPADAYVAVFGFVQDGRTPALSNESVNARFVEFIRSLEKLGIKRTDIYVDFIAQNRIFEYTEEGNTITERLTGFESKKNIAIRYKDRNLLEKILSAAGSATIFDLIEVDYIVNDSKSLRARMFEEAVRVIKQKETSYENSFEIKLTPAALTNEKYDAFYPGEQYQSYQAFESGSTYSAYNKTVIRPRKVTTFYYEPLTTTEFDAVINPAGIEPVVQFTLYLRIQYDLPDTNKK
jgi:uncharacterized protein YggE